MPIYTYTVTGKGHFPMDMLRRDNCWPEDGEAVVSIGARPDDTEGFFEVTRMIRLASGHSPNMERWLSFGWTVRDVRKT